MVLKLVSLDRTFTNASSDCASKCSLHFCFFSFCFVIPFKVGVTRLHMEEDSAKMNHQGAESLSGSTHSLVDFNRAGTPLAEIVSEPDMRAGVEAAEYGRELQRVSYM